MSASAIDTIKSSTLRETVHRAVLPSGLTVFFCPKVGFRKKYACYSTFYGSVDNRFRVPGHAEATSVPDGIAHFLEHTLFETENGNASDLFARHGAYNNAMTSFNTTTYLFASAERFYDNLQLLLNFVENPVFDPEKVDKERGIIEQEIQRYRDNPGWVGYMGLLENLFVNHPLRIDIAGTPESIQDITAELLHRCYRTFYHPSNMMLFVVGDLDGAELMDFAAAHSHSPNASPAGGPQKRFYPEEPGAVATPASRKAMPISMPKLLLGFKERGIPEKGAEFFAWTLASELAVEVLFGRSSDTYQELYEQQLIMDDFGASYEVGPGIGYCTVGGETPDPERLQSVIMERVAKLRRNGIDAADFEREKRRFLGSFIATFNSLEYIASYFTYYQFYEYDLFDAVDLLGEIHLDAVVERMESLLDTDRFASFTVVPE